MDTNHLAPVKMNNTNPLPAELLDTLLLQCVAFDASDLHVASEQQPYWRIHGKLAPRQDQAIVTTQQMQQLVDHLLEGLNPDRLKTIGDQDGAISASDGTRFRFNVYRRQGELSVALRKLEDHFQTLEALGLPESLYDFSSFADGLIVFAGPTGAGKSTTLATLLHRINQTREGHIVTIEDPVEYIHQPIKSMITQREIGRDTRSFADALVASLRQDPDVILVGEVRDLDTIRIALNAAETGHLVFTTVHAGDCVGAIERLVSVFPADEQDGVRRQLSLVLRGIVAQHLLIAENENQPPSAPGVATGPAARPRVVASEILRSTSAVANLIAVGKSTQIYSSIETGTKFGMQTLEQDLARLLSEGVISEAAAMAVARQPNIVHDRLAGMRSGRGSKITTGARR